MFVGFIVYVLDKELFFIYFHVGDDRPTSLQLHSHFIEKYASQWEKLGILLGLEDYHIEIISRDNENNPKRCEACCNRVLEKWLLEIPSPTWGKLDDAIRNLSGIKAIEVFTLHVIYLHRK